MAFFFDDLKIRITFTIVMNVSKIALMELKPESIVNVKV